MTGTIILIVVIIAIYHLGKYAIKEGRRIEDHKEFMENLKKWDNHKTPDKKKEIIYERNPDTDKIRSRKLGDYDNTIMYDDGVCEGEYDHDAIRGED